LLLIPVMDFYGRGAAADAAMARITPEMPADKRPSLAWGDWLKLPWAEIYLHPTAQTLTGKELLPEATAAQADRTREGAAQPAALPAASRR